MTNDVPRAFALMIQGTASGVGKSVLTAAACRILARRGLRVAPFKAQNMSNNAAVTTAGGEIGRAQALQARAAGLEPDVRFNPVLLKPLSDTRSDIVVLGQRRPDIGAVPWHQRRHLLWPIIAETLRGLQQEFEILVIEGAGSPAEINLRHSDIVNMHVAHAAHAAVLLVADIDRGGAFAALAGTCALLCEADRARIRGFVLNKFRGDLALLAPGPEMLQTRTGIPVVGVVPYVRHALPDEDAFAMPTSSGDIRIAAIRLPYISNFDDLDPLAAERNVQVQWTNRIDDVHAAHAIVIPGTRNTLADLRWMWESGLAAAIAQRARSHVPVLGLCGGYQMLGKAVTDPLHIEDGGSVPGLALLDITTELVEDKTTRLCCATITGGPSYTSGLRGTSISGYEIHHGRSAVAAGSGWLERDGEILGAANGSVAGAYLHGLFANDALRHAFLASIGASPAITSWEGTLDREIDRVADHVEAAVDIAGLVHLWRA
jgi:adenosylcobyric acid synthase